MSFYCISAANDDLKTYFKGLLPDQHHNEQSVLVSDYIKTLVVLWNDDDDDYC